MKVIRSTKCTLKFSTAAKLATLEMVLAEYGQVTNFFIQYLWVLPKVPSKSALLKPIVDLPKTWLSARLRKVAAREAISMIVAAKRRWKDKAVQPTHNGKSMYVSSTIAELHEAQDATEFDYWLKLWSIGRGIIFHLPIRLHQHYHKLAARGKRLNSYVITAESVTFAFETDTGLKRTEGHPLGVDTGIKALATTSDGLQLGTDIQPMIERINRCKHGSKGQKTARRALKQRMDEVARDLLEIPDIKIIVVENLRGLNHKSRVKRRLTKNMRRSLGSWAYRYWLGRVQGRCEDNRVVFKAVNPAYTSQRCPECGYTERGNRNGEVFKCRKCGHTDNADVNAARNILTRFRWGPYGAPFKPSVKVMKGTVVPDSFVLGTVQSPHGRIRLHCSGRGHLSFQGGSNGESSSADA